MLEGWLQDDARTRFRSDPSGGMLLMYPWSGEFRIGNPDSCVAVATLSAKIDLPEDKVAIWGEIRTENIGVEKVVANVISNPNIRRLVVWGEDVRGHRSGDALIALNENGIDAANRVLGSSGALPYIENIDAEAVQRYSEQIEVIDMIGNTSMEDLLAEIGRILDNPAPPMAEPFIAIRIERSGGQRMTVGESIAVHATLVLDPYGDLEPLEAP
jgi:tetrahydromethanopterin S-methyltransferase subunit A